MNITIVYDSIFGNTALVAKAVAAELEREHHVTVATVQEAKKLELSGTDLLVVGSPTRGFQPTPQIAEYLAGLGPIPSGMVGAVFDTRLDLETVNPLPLRWVMDIGGYAAARMASALQRHGIELRGDQGDFRVTNAEGPLKEGEIGRAREWAISLMKPGRPDLPDDQATPTGQGTPS